MIISHNDKRFSWQGHVSLEETDAYTRPWRIPFASQELFPQPLLVPAATQAGVRLTFHSDTRRLAGAILPCEKKRALDLYIDSQYFDTVDLTGQSSFLFPGLPAGKKHFELWLPQRSDFALQHLEIDDAAILSPAQDTRPKWVAYGSSITHCGEAEKPSYTWPGVVARARNLNLTCLGYGGQCHLDVQVARMMRDMPADYITICAGINIYSGSLNVRTFIPSLVGFVQLLREAHPQTPIGLISPIYSFEREKTQNAVGWTLEDYRHAVAEVAQLLESSGDRNILYINGLDLFDERLGHLMPDQLHPNAEGYCVLGENFLKQAASKLFN